MWIIAINPNSGKGGALQVGDEVRNFLESHRLKYRWVLAPNASALSERLLELVAGQDKADPVSGIIAVGGDGLAHLVLQIAVPAKIAFALVPTGTGNDIARSMGWSQSDTRRIMERITSVPPSPIDLGIVDSEWFGAILSTGFDSVVNERANQLNWPKGGARYNAALALEFPKFSPLEYEITCDGDSFTTEAMLVAVGNGSSYGAGMKICADADMNDGLFDLIILEPISKIEFIKVFPSVYSGKHIEHPRVKSLRGQKVRINGNAIAYADGERIGPAPVTAECISGAGLTWIP